ncbi:MAG: carbon-nitrogen family hydrolase [Bacillaceae bacterium]|nr:carbon-nitrogen family hydrolase [Bacillaceae bacterium]
MNVQFGDPEANYKKVEQFVADAVNAREKPDVIVFPELLDTAYDLTRLDKIGDRGGERARSLFSRLARQHQVHIVGGSIAQKTKEGTYNTSYVFNDRGELLHEYSKVHLFRLMEEEKYLLAGDRIGVFSLGDVPSSLQICYDIRFPEGVRKGALLGSKVLFVVAQWPHPRLQHWRQLLIARAIENQMYVVACNRVGEGGGNIFCGHSMVIDPWGEIVVEAMQNEEIIQAEIDTDNVDQIRKQIPVFGDRRPQIYE